MKCVSERRRVYLLGIIIKSLPLHHPFSTTTGLSSIVRERGEKLEIKVRRQERCTNPHLHPLVRWQRSRIKFAAFCLSPVTLSENAWVYHFFFLKNYYPPVDLGQSRVTHKSEGAGIVNCISQGYSSPLKCLPYLNPIY